MSEVTVSKAVGKAVGPLSLWVLLWHVLAFVYVHQSGPGLKTPKLSPRSRR
jgi:hypothetical protein